MRAIIGYGNELRGEDAFGLDVIKKLQNYSCEDTKLISAFCLTPELVLELLEVDEILFIDACYETQDFYALACSIQKSRSNLSHQIEPQTLIALLENVYHKKVDYWIYSMLTNNFDEICDLQQYDQCIDALTLYISIQVH